jgi:uncharacterized RDD family membrane protein YckC
METIEQDILVDLQPRLVHANTGKRLANYFIDLVIFYLLFFVGALALFVASPDTAEGSSDTANTLWLRLFAMLTYGLYMGLLEGVFKGRTVGKFITGTKVVNEDGSPISFSTALARGFCRIVPFEPLSAFGNPWHDKWNKTYVIDVRGSRLE